MSDNKKMSTFILEKHSEVDINKMVEFFSMCSRNIKRNIPNAVLPELMRLEYIKFIFELKSEFFTSLRDENARGFDVRFTFKLNNFSDKTDVIDMKFLLTEKGWDVYAQSLSDFFWLSNTLIKITKNIIYDHEPGCVHFPIIWGKIKY